METDGLLLFSSVQKSVVACSYWFRLRDSKVMGHRTLSDSHNHRNPQQTRQYTLWLFNLAAVYIDLFIDGTNDNLPIKNFDIPVRCVELP
jgi:hypothetical protein